MYNTFLLGFLAHFCLVFLFSVRYRSMIHKYVLKYVVNSLCHADKKKSTSKMYSLICCSLWFLTCYVPISSKHFVITLCIILYSVLRRSMPYLTPKRVSASILYSTCNIYIFWLYWFVSSKHTYLLLSLLLYCGIIMLEANLETQMNRPINLLRVPY